MNYCFLHNPQSSEGVCPARRGRWEREGEAGPGARSQRQLSAAGSLGMSGRALGPLPCAARDVTPAWSCPGGIMLLHGRTGCDQANGLRVLVCIYLYGVNSEPLLKGCAGRASTYIYGEAAFTSILTHSASRCSCFSPLPSKGAISGGCAPKEAFLSWAFLSWAFLSSALHTYAAQRRPLVSPLTWIPHNRAALRVTRVPEADGRALASCALRAGAAAETSV